MSAARTPAPGRSSERAITAIVPAEIAQTPAASPSTPSIRLITLITATMPTIVSRWPRWTWPITARSTISTERRLTEPTNGRVKEATLTPLSAGIAAATVCPISLNSAGRSKTSSTMPTIVITIAPASSAWVCWAQGRKSTVAAATPTKIARPPSFGIGLVCRLRSFGWSIAPIRHATRSATGTRSQARSAATPNAKSA